MKKILETTAYVSAICAIITLTAFTEKDLGEMKYEQLRVNVFTDEGNFFVTPGEVEQAVKNAGYVTGDVTLKNINIRSLEEFFDRYPYIRKSQVFSTGKGELIVEIKQRNPILRVFDKYEGSYYIDEEGLLMPVSENFTSDVPVASGQISAPYNLNYGIDFSSEEDLDRERKSHRLLRDLYVLTTTLREDELWEAQFNQIYINDKNEIELIPRVGNHSIILGSTDQLNEKLRKLKIFYFDGLTKTGWNEYEEINLKFENQVVCTKKQVYESARTR